MSLKNTKKYLIAALADTENRVVAMSGKWGTGKSHLWRELRDESADEEIKRAVYVSVFGVSDINQLQLKALRSAIPLANKDPKRADQLGKISKIVSDTAKSLFKGFSALDELTLLGAPHFLGGRVVVLDDIERKHAKLSVDEILGFIDEYTQQHDTRFVLILNDDKLDDAGKAAWAMLREKVIDTEIRLITTPEESFEIARTQTRMRDDRVERTKAVVDTLSVDNIRVLRRIIRNVNRILPDRPLQPEILQRVIPSIALLTAIHYGALDDGPDISFVLNPRKFARGLLNFASGDQGSGDPKHAEWRVLLRDLKIADCDDFEDLVVAYLSDGQLDGAAVSAIIDRYAGETDRLHAQQAGISLENKLYWDVDTSEEKLVAEAKSSLAYARHLDAFRVTYIHNELARMPGGQEVGEAFVRAWIEGYESREKTGDFESLDYSRLHPDIVNAMNAEQSQRRAISTASLFDVVRRIVKQSAWGTAEELAMRKATAADFEDTIRNSSTDDRAFFLRHMTRMRVETTNYDSYFGEATQRFVDALRNILASPSSERLARLIRRVVEDTVLAQELGVSRETANADERSYTSRPTAPTNDADRKVQPSAASIEEGRADPKEGASAA